VYCSCYSNTGGVTVPAAGSAVTSNAEWQRAEREHGGDEQRRAGCELEGEGGFADLLHDCEDKGVEESAHGAVVTGGV
jgi:hypothetical protein